MVLLKITAFLSRHSFNSSLVLLSNQVCPDISQRNHCAIENQLQTGIKCIVAKQTNFHRQWLLCIQHLCLQSTLYFDHHNKELYFRSYLNVLIYEILYLKMWHEDLPAFENIVFRGHITVIFISNLFLSFVYRRWCYLSTYCTRWKAHIQYQAYSM